MQTEKQAFVIYNQHKGFRSARAYCSYNKNFTKAVLYTMKHHANRASNTGDIIIPIEMKLDPEEMFTAILKG